MNLELDNVYIDNLKLEDLNDYHEMCSDTYLSKMAGFKVHDNMQISKTMLLSMIITDSAFGIYCKITNKLIGVISYLKAEIRKHDNALKVGIFINKDYQNKGIATSCIKASIDYIFNNSSKCIIEAIVLKENINSRKLFLKLGFNEDGFLVKYKKMYDKKLADVYIYSLVKK